MIAGVGVDNYSLPILSSSYYVKWSSVNSSSVTVTSSFSSINCFGNCFGIAGYFDDDGCSTSLKVESKMTLNSYYLAKIYDHIYFVAKSALLQAIKTDGTLGSINIFNELQRAVEEYGAIRTIP